MSAKEGKMMKDKGMTFLEYVEELKKGIGRVYINEWGSSMAGPSFPRPVCYFNTQVTRDSIKHFVDAIGDINPLYRDREYAKGTKYGCLIAPPTILYTIALAHYPEPLESPPLVEYPPLYTGDDYEWYAPICEGDEIDWKTVFPTKIEMKQTKTAGATAFIYGRHEFSRHQGGIPLAACNFWVLVYDRNEFQYWPAEKKEKVSEIPKFPEYTEEYIKEVYAAQDRETVRGATPRFWEDVEVGEELTPVVRGPFTVDESVAWIIGSGEYFFCSDRLFRMIHDHTGWGEYHPELKVYLNFKHGTYEFNPKGVGGWAAQRTTWVDMMLTNWVGDDGFVWKLRSEHRRRGGYGNVFWCRANVTRKYTENGHFCLDLEHRVEDQTSALILRGTASVLLPSREHGPVIYPTPPSPSSQIR